MKRILSLLFVLLFLSACQKDDPATTLEELSGFVQKGPYVNGTAITISELNSNLNPTGKTFSTQIVDNRGSFAINEVTLNSVYVEIRADGFYFDEIKGEVSAAQLTLFGLADISNKSTVNVNILTQLEKNRVQYLLGEGYSFSEAKSKAQQEIFTIFDIEISDIKDSETLDISVSGDDNAALLAVSSILQSDRTVGDLTELLAVLSNDIEEDGILSSSSIFEELFVSASSLDVMSIRENLEGRYLELGIQASIGNFEKYVSNFVDKDLSELLLKGFPLGGLLEAGYEVSELINAGADVKDLFDAGVMVGTLEESGATKEQLTAAELIGIVDDPDGREYKWVKIGDQIWMAENYAYLPSIGGGIWVFGFHPDDGIEAIKQSSEYKNRGCLYNLANAINLSPNGWHLPINEDWKELERFVGMPEDEIDDHIEWRGEQEAIGYMLKSNSSWRNLEGMNGNGSNSTGFNAISSGMANTFRGTVDDPDFWDYAENDVRTYFWVSDLYFDTPIVRGFDCSNAGIVSDNFWSDMGIPVRYVKDE